MPVYRSVCCYYFYLSYTWYHWSLLKEFLKIELSKKNSDNLKPSSGYNLIKKVFKEIRL